MKQRLGYLKRPTRLMNESLVNLTERGFKITKFALKGRDYNGH